MIDVGSWLFGCYVPPRKSRLCARQGSPTYSFGNFQYKTKNTMCPTASSGGICSARCVREPSVSGKRGGDISCLGAGPVSNLIPKLSIHPKSIEVQSQIVWSTFLYPTGVREHDYPTMYRTTS